jgi:hypothetical protein
VASSNTCSLTSFFGPRKCIRRVRRRNSLRYRRRYVELTPGAPSKGLSKFTTYAISLSRLGRCRTKRATSGPSSGDRINRRPSRCASSPFPTLLLLHPIIVRADCDCSFKEPDRWTRWSGRGCVYERRRRRYRSMVERYRWFMRGGVVLLPVDCKTGNDEMMKLLEEQNNPSPSTKTDRCASEAKCPD